MARTSQVLEPTAAPSRIDSTNALNLREFVVDEDAAHFNSALWKTIDQSAFVMAQREALEAFNVAKALRLSEETAAEESKRRTAAAATSASASTSAAAATSSGGRNSSATKSQPIPIKRVPHHPSHSDEAAAISLARSWQVDALQPALLENKPSTSTSSTVMPVPASSSSPPSSRRERKSSVSIARQPSQNLSLSTSSSSFIQLPVLDSRIASDSLHSHSRATSHSNSVVIPSSSQSHSHRIEQRSLSKREPEPSSSSMSHSTTSRPQISDVTNTKRRRTERQPSVSSSPPNVLVAPPISEPKKSTASARDLRLGQMLNPAKENSTPPAQIEPTRSRRRSTHKTSEGRDLFTATRNCVKCGNLVVSPRSQPSFTHDPFSLPFSDLLHVTCSACGTNHCRGCFTVVRCPRQCAGGPSCTVRNCCPDIRAIAIFEALSSFDHIYATEAGFAGKGGKQQRQAYIKLLISKADKSMRTFEDAFVRTLRILCSWMQVSSPDDASEEERRGLHPSVSILFSNSYLPEVMHGFLSNNNVRDWVAHSETYSVVLDTLRRMFDCGLSPVLMEPLRHIDQSCGLQGLVWDEGSITWEMDKNNVPVRSAPLSELVRQLEAHRGPLRALAGKVQFSSTVEKVNNLCDGISYLLLQQVVGGI
ncbi:hypothetical protein GALMADRAFT_235069 [Galerina marginata CBS 339.88]|uniref:Uncharacterized protein n=1 Tax=Galerina marginata (strain CBS 339.88) TaxID=685588 RepID=A0A067TU94_GALM3|nr:hypothetical protein GALMADRAFT_235069 [Galerina marginata CBS 339.88]